jgi:hypothetical protein
MEPTVTSLRRRFSRSLTVTRSLKSPISSPARPVGGTREERPLWLAAD